MEWTERLSMPTRRRRPVCRGFTASGYRLLARCRIRLKLKPKRDITVDNKRGASERISNDSTHVAAQSGYMSWHERVHAASMRVRTSACRGIPPETMADV